MDIYNSFINTLDTDIIELLSIRQKYKLNSKNFKVYELGGYSKDDTFISNFDRKIELYESNNQIYYINMYILNLLIIKIIKYMNLFMISVII